MIPLQTSSRRGGFSLVELMAASAILTLLALMAVPYSQTAKDRELEVQLIDSLNRLRRAITLYAWNEDDGDNDGDGVRGEDPQGDPDGDGISDDDGDGRVDEDGAPNFPPVLDELVTRGFLSSVPPDPFQLVKTGAPDWGVVTATRRSTWTTAGAITVDVAVGVVDVRTKSLATGLDGTYYATW